MRLAWIIREFVGVNEKLRGCGIDCHVIQRRFKRDVETLLSDEGQAIVGWL